MRGRCSWVFPFVADREDGSGAPRRRHLPDLQVKTTGCPTIRPASALLSAFNEPDSACTHWSVPSVGWCFSVATTQNGMAALLDEGRLHRFASSA